MSDAIQTLVVALAVLAALGYVARKAWRILRPPKAEGCSSGCGCEPASGESDWARTS